MTEPKTTPPTFAGTLRLFARHAVAAGENRLELFLLEVQEERERAFQTLGLMLGTAALALLAGFTFTIGIVVVLWDQSHIWPVVVLTLLYAGGGAMLYRSLRRRLHDWQTLPETFDQFRRDCAALNSRLG